MAFDFHHHHLNKYGIYNLNLGEIPKEYLIYSIGFHPQDIQFLRQKDWDWFYHYSKSPLCWAIGECGLDAFVSASEEHQNEVLEKQILWANEIQKPVIIHCVRRFSQMLRFKKIAKTPMIIHGFNKKQNIAKELLHNGFYLSFGKAVLHNPQLQEVLRNTPMDRIFLETDGEDFNIEELYLKVSVLNQISITELEKEIVKNINTILGGTYRENKIITNNSYNIKNE